MATLESRLNDLITAIGTDWKTFNTSIGVIGNLATTATNLVAAINEVKATADAAVAGTAPDATETVKGIIEIATNAEALAMAATAQALVPANLAAIVNVNNGLLKLDATGKVAAAQLPSYVDDVLEFANLAAFPGTGETGIIYVALDTNLTYRWTGSVYTEISASPGTTDAVPEGATNLYYTSARAQADADLRITALVGNTDADLAAAYATAKA